MNMNLVPERLKNIKKGRKKINPPSRSLGQVMNMYLEPQRLKKRKKGRKDQPDDLQPRSSHEHESSTPKTQKEKERKKNINLMT